MSGLVKILIYGIIIIKTQTNIWYNNNIDHPECTRLCTHVV